MLTPLIENAPLPSASTAPKDPLNRASASGTLSEAKTLSLTQQLLQLQAQFEAANA